MVIVAPPPKPLNLEEGQVTFQYKDYRSQDKQKSRSMTITAEEFIRRFLLHAIPPGFQRFRHYGLPASRNKKQTLALCRQLLDIEYELLPTRSEVENYQHEVLAALILCPRCGKGPMIRMETIFPCRWPDTKRESRPR